jgi:glycosyltransferase domain-containing protein
MQNTCIVIPTHERHDYLPRCIAYYQNFSCKIVICDSSKIPYTESLAKNIAYYHLPGKSFVEKILFALGDVGMNFIALAPDDDFLFEGSLVKGVDALKNEPECQACVGDVLTFPDKLPFRVVSRCVGRGSNVGIFSPEENIYTYLSNYHQVLWSLFRYDVLKLCFQIIEQAKFKNENFFELILATICAGRGGINYIDDYWILREVTMQDHWGLKHIPITKSSICSMVDDLSKFYSIVNEVLYNGAGEQAIEAYLSKGDYKLNIFSLVKKFVFKFSSRFIGSNELNLPCIDSDTRFNLVRIVIAEHFHKKYRP